MRRPRRLLWHAFGTSFLIAAASAALVLVFAWGTAHQILRDQPEARERFDMWLGVAAVLSLAGAGLFSYMAARSLARPVEEMRDGAEQFGRGNLSRRIPPMPTEDLAELAEALNRMAAQLDQRIFEITRQRNEHEAILESMREGVLAVDGQERILGLNRVAEQMLGVSAKEARGKLVQEVLRVVELQRFIHDSLTSAEDAGREMPLKIGEKLALVVRSQPLLDGGKRRFGLLIILTDLTQIQRLENLRRDFAANVSHELRTPITSIKGYAETLLDGALDDPAEARRFVETILRQSDRLVGVIEDLLRLSRLERSGTIEREECVVSDLVRQAEELCEESAQRNEVEIKVRCPKGLRARLSPRLTTQAISNLLQNAITYGREGKRVELDVADGNGAVVIRVTDFGPGIAEEHLSRLFERFYRVDKARSRDAGGTGLGLAIVKHVAQAHGGEVTVESRVGEGSTFTMRLPDR